MWKWNPAGIEHSRKAEVEEVSEDFRDRVYPADRPDETEVVIDIDEDFTDRVTTGPVFPVNQD